MLESLDLPSATAISCQGVAKEFGSGSRRVGALRGADLEVRFGQLTLIVGPSGSGKSTLLAVMTGLLPPDRGQVEVLGADLSSLSASELVRFRGCNVGMVFQRLNLLPALTVLDNVAIPAHALRHPPGPARARARRLLAELGLGAHAHRYPDELSLGEQQRVAIARALVHEPRLVVCDEPTAALDAKAGRTVIELLREVAVRSDRAVIVVTHDERILRFADRIALMSDGRITGIETRNVRDTT